MIKKSWAVKCGDFWYTVSDSTGNLVTFSYAIRLGYNEARDVARVAKQYGKTVEVVNLDKKVKK